MKAPYLVDLSVVLIFFNRPGTLKRVFGAIRDARPSRLFLVQDGPRKGRPEDLDKIMECRRIVDEIDWECEVYRDYAKENMSAHLRIFSGITGAFEHCGSLMVLEDDVVPALSYFRFCAELLERYKDDRRIHYINGVNRLSGFPRSDDSYFFSMVGTGFGLATWKRVWDEVVANANYGFLNDEVTVKKIENMIRYVYPRCYQRHLQMARKTREKDWLAGVVTSWERPFGITQTINGTLCITPVHTMFEYIGIGEDATYSGSDLRYLPKQYQMLLTPQLHEISFPLRHPRYVIRDVEYEKKHDRIYANSFLVSRVLRMESLIRRLLFGNFKELLNKLILRTRSKWRQKFGIRKEEH